MSTPWGVTATSIATDSVPFVIPILAGQLSEQKEDPFIRVCLDCRPLYHPKVVPVSYLSQLLWCKGSQGGEGGGGRGREEREKWEEESLKAVGALGLLLVVVLCTTVQWEGGGGGGEKKKITG